MRGSVENLPDIRFAFDGPGALDSYALTNALAYDVGAGAVRGRSRTWVGPRQLRVHTSAAWARLRATSVRGSRYFAEGGGGIQSGPLGFEISAKFGWNRLSEPVEHRFLTLPINMRATVSF